MTPEHERLAEAVARLQQQQKEILERLARLEAGQPKLRRDDHKPARQRTAAAPAFETRMGLMWVNRIGVVTLVLGAAFFFKYAVESGWIGFAARVLIGAVSGLAGLAAGERAWRAGRRVYGQGVSAAGVGILYVTCYAAFGLYHFIAQPAAFLLLFLVTAAATALALRYNAPALAALALLGGYITPWLLGRPSPWFVMGYATLLNAGAAYLARARAWRGLAALGIAGATGAYLGSLPATHGYTAFVLGWYALFYAVEARWVLAPAQALSSVAVATLWTGAPVAFFASALAPAAAGLRRWPGAAFGAFWLAYLIWWVQSGRPAVFVLALLTVAFALFLNAAVHSLPLLAWNAGAYLAGGYALLVSRHDAWLGLFAAALAAVHFAVARFTWRRGARTGELAAGIGCALLVLAAPLQFSGYRITQVWSLEAAALAWIGRRARYGAVAVFALVLLRLLFVDRWTPHARLFTFALAAVCFWAAAWWTRTGWPALAEYVAGHFTILWGLGLEVLAWAARTAAPANLRSVESSSLSILMAGYSVMLVTLGFTGGSPINRSLGLGLIAVVVMKLYLYDVWYLGLFYRMAAFAVLGALLLAMSYLYSRTWRRNRT